MKTYVGQARGSRMIERLTGYGFGEMTVREEFPPRRTPWVFDNGAFKDWRAGVAFRSELYERALDRFAASSSAPPDFLVVPDVVADGAASLAFSLEWRERLTWLDVPLYLVVQDGMTESVVRAELDGFDGLFVGGSPRWKLMTAQQWIDFAHLHGKPCHLGRMGTTRKVRAARRWGADSIDSALPLWAEANLQRFLRGFTDPESADLFE